MLEILDTKVPAVLGFRLSGRLTHEDYERMIPLLHRQIERSGGVRTVVDLRDLAGVEPRALLDELKFDARHARDVERCAIVGDEGWQETLTRISRPVFGRDRVRFFAPEDVDAAWAFAGEGAHPPLDDPDDVVDSPELDREEKEAALDEMSYDERLRLIGDDEGYQGGRPPQLAEVAEARRRLGKRPVVVATDFSADARSAYGPALDLARRLGAELHLVNVVVPASTAGATPTAGIPVMPPTTGVDEAQLLRDLRRRMDEEATRLAANAPNDVVHGEVVTGTSPDAALVEFAEARDAELIALASHARTGLARVFEGSVAESLQRRSERPVVVLSPEGGTAFPERIHVGIAIERPTEDGVVPGLGAALSLAHALEARVTLLHAITPLAVGGVHDPGPDDRAPRPEAEEMMKRVREAIGDPSVESVVVEGGAIDEILREAADQRGVDLLCLASRGRGGLSRLLFGSTAETVLRGAKIPVAILPHDSATTDVSITDRGRTRPHRKGRKEGSVLKNPAAVTHMGKLIRGEISAIETYVQAIDKVEDKSAVDALHTLKNNHIDATNTLREQVHALGGEPPTDSGPWGSFAKAVEGAAKLLGNGAALRALREGEELGVHLYEEALEDERLPGETRRVIREKLLPRQKSHVEAIKQLAQSV